MSKAITSKTMTNKNKSKSTEPKSKRLIVKKRKKVIIITLSIIIIITGISVGLYFAFRTVYDLPNNIVQINQKTLTNKIEDTMSGEEEETWGLYIGTTECQYCKNMLYGPEDENGNWDTENANGAFPQYVDSGNSNIEWYMLDDHKKSSPEEQLKRFHNAIGDAFENDSGEELDDGQSFPIEFTGNISSSTPINELEDAIADPEEIIQENSGDYLLTKNGDDWDWSDTSPINGTPTLIVFDHSATNHGGIVSLTSGYNSGGEDGTEGQTEDWYLAWDAIITEYLN